MIKLGLYSIVSLISILNSPFSCSLYCAFRVSFEEVGNFLVEWVVKVGCAHQCLNREEYGSNLEGGTPFILEDVKANSAEFINVRVEDFRTEKNLWSDHGILIWEIEFSMEHTTFVGGSFWSCYFNKEVTVVLLRWFCVNTNYWLLSKSLSFFHNSWWCCHYFLVLNRNRYL